MAKRQLANSPPPGNSPLALPKPKKARQSKAAAAAAAQAAANAQTPQGSPPAASSPAFQPEAADTPRLPRSRSGSPSGKAKRREEDDDEDAEAEDDEAEESEREFSDDEFGVTQRENIRQKENLRVLLEHFDAGQMDRYEHYRRSGLAKSSVRKLVNQVLQQSVSPTILTVVRGFAKVFVGELVEKAREVATHDGPLTPTDLREAYRLYLVEHEGVGGTRKKMFAK